MLNQKIVLFNNTLKTNGKETTIQNDIIMQLVNKSENGGKNLFPCEIAVAQCDKKFSLCNVINTNRPVRCIDKPSNSSLIKQTTM